MAKFWSKAAGVLLLLATLGMVSCQGLVGAATLRWPLAALGLGQ